MNDKRTTTSKILEAIAEYGPMTTREICDLIGIDLMVSGSLVARLVASRKTVPKRLYVQSWVYDAEGQKLYPRAVYALGDQPCAKRPKASRVKNQQRYREKLKARYKANSVFNLGATLKTVEQTRKRNAANDAQRAGTVEAA